MVCEHIHVLACSLSHVPVPYQCKCKLFYKHYWQVSRHQHESREKENVQSLQLNIVIVPQPCYLRAATNSFIGRSVGCLVGWSTKNPPPFDSPGFFPRRLKFGMRSCVCVCVKVCLCQMAKRGVAVGVAYRKRRITSQWIHRLAQELVEQLVMSQRRAD